MNSPSGLFVPGDEAGLWPGAACKASPDMNSPSGLFVPGDETGLQGELLA